MPTYAVTGASGHLGRLAVQELLARGVPASDVVAVVRTRGKAADLAGLGVQVREADYSRPETLGAALAGVERLLLVSSSEPGQRVAHHTNVIQAAKTAGTSRVVYTSMLNADNTTNPLAGEHQDSERALREADVPFTLLRNGWYTENYTDQTGQYLEAGEIVGAAGHGRISAASRPDYAAAAAAALLEEEEGNRTYELGGPAFGLSELARIITEVTGTKVTYRDLPVEEYASRLQRAGLDEATAHFVAALDASIARGDLETSSQDLAELLGRPATPLTRLLEMPSTGLRERKKARTRRLIADTAARLFAERGYEHVAVSDVAREAEVAEQTVYNHFRTKEQLVTDRDQQIQDRLCDLIRSRPPAITPAAAIRDFVLKSVAGIRRIPPEIWHGELGYLAAISPTVHRLALELTDRQAAALAGAISDTTAVPPEVARLQAIALAGVFQIIISEAGQRTVEGQSQAEIADELYPIVENILDELDRWLSVSGPPARR
jgi:NAD(P)H dehydrogenase (quinone)